MNKGVHQEEVTSFDDPFFLWEVILMESTIRDVLEFIEENDVKFIRLAFCDLLGNQKNISVMPSQIDRVFREGICFDASAIEGFQEVGESDLYLIPDAKTLDILPWRPSTGRVIRLFCEIHYPDGRLYEKDCRTMLKQKLSEVHELGFDVMSGLECEFYVFEQAENSPTLIPIDQGGYFDIFPKDKGEDLRRDICLTLEEMGITPESSHHEQGPGQNEIDFHFDDALISCDHFMTFKWVVDSVANSHEVITSFMPKPIKDQSGSGLHINLSLANNNHNAFSIKDPTLLQHFIAGILAHIRELTLFLNPTPNSYERFGEFEAPMYVNWSHSNRSALIRVPAASEDYVRVEVRSSDPTCNAYLASYLLICAGMKGIAQQLPLQEESKGNLFEQPSTLPTLPLSLREAITAAQDSAFLKEVLPDGVLEYYAKSRERMVEQAGI